MSVNFQIPFTALPARKEIKVEQPRMTWIVDRPRLLELLAPRYDWKPSMNAICKDAGLSGSRTHDNWSEFAVKSIARHFGIEAAEFATPREHLRVGRPKEKRNRTCPKVVRVDPDLQELITQAANVCGMAPVDWIHHVLQASVTFTVGKEPRQ